MKKILVINGPNLNMLGIREPEIYGTATYRELEASIRTWAKEMDFEVQVIQSNHEGDIIDAIQAAYRRIDGIIINPAGYTHTSVSIADAIKAVGIPAVEVHISDTDKREDFRKVSYIRPVCIATIKGKGFLGYKEALQMFRASS
ncbi:MAG: type II 3-dehydroquinate dehydratase [Spirochaetia bacterium]|nr:type II 3-dehydroquinate dehydratase [Spirochaetia bacterium]MBQ3713864.1 type II 3-dehydroquinate dehydratase [Spirochaetia bacterium]MBQ6673022.1 type II 3-dehydroquinate dehydratase [Spirochaetia bacterium]